MLVFSNPGELDSRSFTIFGLNSKPEKDNPIGFFGTGLKYAIAIAMRYGADLAIQSGLTTYTFSTAETTFRDKTFSAISVQAGPDDPPSLLPFTTELGKNWEPWQAYREFYCNALDENGTVRETDDPRDLPLPCPGQTSIILSGKSFAEVYLNRHIYFLEDQPLAETSEGKIHSLHPTRPSYNIFYCNICVGKLDRPGLFTYNISTSLQLSEDRLYINPYILPYCIGNLILDSGDENIIKSALCASEDTYEGNLPWKAIGVGRIAPILIDLWKNRRAALSKPAFVAARELILRTTNELDHNTTELEAKMIERARSFLNDIGYVVENPIVVTSSLSDKYLGTVEGSKILISPKNFELGMKQLTITILEEHLHLKYDFDDCSRKFQDYLITKVVSLAAELNGEIL